MNQTPFILWLTSLTMNNVWSGVKVLYLLAFIVYVIFAAVIVSQVKQMAVMLVGGFEKQLVALSWLHLLISIVAFVWAIVIL